MNKNNKIKTKTITYKDLTGQKFGHLTVLKLDNIKNRTRYWLCECDCELHNKKIVKERYLTNGDTQSCGCIRGKNTIPFMISGATLANENKKLYGVWKNIMHRCHNKNNNKYHEYGAKGISVCEEWKDYDTFYYWSMQNGYKEGLALIRKNINGNYEPLNCVWDLKVNYRKIQHQYDNEVTQDKINIIENKIINMNNYVRINEHDIKIVEYNNQRVLSSSEIAKAHNLENRNVKENFNNNKKYLIENEDYFILTKVDYELTYNEKLPKYYNAIKEIILFTEQGYLMIARTFTGDLAWRVQRELVTNYFKMKELKENVNTKDIPEVKSIASIDILETIVNTFKEQQTKITDLENKYIKLENKLQKIVKQ